MTNGTENDLKYDFNILCWCCTLWMLCLTLLQSVCKWSLSEVMYIMEVMARFCDYYRLHLKGLKWVICLVKVWSVCSNSYNSYKTSFKSCRIAMWSLMWMRPKMNHGYVLSSPNFVPLMSISWTCMCVLMIIM